MWTKRSKSYFSFHRKIKKSLKFYFLKIFFLMFWRNFWQKFLPLGLSGYIFKLFYWFRNVIKTSLFPSWTLFRTFRNQKKLILMSENENCCFWKTVSKLHIAWENEKHNICSSAKMHLWMQNRQNMTFLQSTTIDNLLVTITFTVQKMHNTTVETKLFNNYVYSEELNVFLKHRILLWKQKLFSNSF